MNKYDDIKLIGLVGKAGSGKDTLADAVAEEGWVKMAFADSLKHMCMDYLGLSYEDAYTQEGKMRMNETWGMTNRSILQKVGTEAMRNGFDKDVWVKMAMIKMKKLLSEGKKVIVTDCRFDNEAEIIESLGGIVVEVVRNTASNLSDKEQHHASEQPVNKKYVSFVVDNNRGIDRIKYSFDTEMDVFAKRGMAFHEKIKPLVLSKSISDEFASRIMLEYKKFIFVMPDAVYPKDGGIRMEWNGKKSAYVEVIGDSVVMKGYADSEMNESFHCGDILEWNKVCGYISTNCR